MRSEEKKKILFCILSTVVIVAALVGISTVAYSSYFKDSIQKRNEDKVKLMAEQMQAFVDGVYGMTEEMSKNPSILTMKTEIQKTILEDCVKRNPFLELLYIQDKEGMQTGRSSGELADRSSRWWFIYEMQTQKPFVSKSYYSVNTGMPCASIFFPMFDAGKEISGVFAVDIKLDYLQSIVTRFSDENSGDISFVIDGEGNVVAHPDSTQIEELYNYKNLTKTVSKKDSQGNVVTDNEGNILEEEQNIVISQQFQEIIENVMNGSSGSAQMENEGHDYYVSYAKIPMKGDSDSWSIILMQRKENALGDYYGFLGLIAGLEAVFVLAAEGLVFALFGNDKLKK